MIRQIKPNPRGNRAADKVEASLADQILAAREALRKAQAAGDDQAVNDATKALLDALDRLRKVAGYAHTSYLCTSFNHLVMERKLEKTIWAI